MRLITGLLLLAQVLTAQSTQVQSPAGQDTSDVDSIDRQMIQLYSEGKYAEAVPLAERAIAIRERTLGPDHPDTASFAAGIVGWQRSLTLSGARAQMLTQWPVNSVESQEFMVRFYSKLAAGETKGDAWIDTQRDLIGKGVAPHFWAPFVLYGDPGPLTEK